MQNAELFWKSLIQEIIEGRKLPNFKTLCINFQETVSEAFSKSVDTIRPDISWRFVSNKIS